MTTPQRVTYPPVLDLVPATGGVWALPPVHQWTSGGQPVRPVQAADGTWLVYGYGMPGWAA